MAFDYFGCHVMTLNRIGVTVAKCIVCYPVPKGWLESINTRVTSLKEQNVLFFSSCSVFLSW